MNDSTPRRLARWVLKIVPATLVITLVTVVCYSLHATFSTVSFLYLVVVVLQSLIGDFISSALVSFISFLCLNYFFVPPIFSLRISDSSDTVALISFLIAGLVITRLTSQVRGAAESEGLQRKEMSRLYELARNLLAVEPGIAHDALPLKSFGAQFDLRAVCMFDAATMQLHSEGNSLRGLGQSTRDAYISGCDITDDGVAVRLLRIGTRAIGAVGFEGLCELGLTADSLAALAAITLEQRRAREQTTRSLAAAEAEVLRGAMLDALAHELKTPLATIVMAAGGIREAGPLRRPQQELAETIEEEASRLGQLTTRLLRLARLDREEIKPQMELTNIREMLTSLIDQYSQRWPERRIAFLAGTRVDAAVDRELLWLGIAQLLDNACKYSLPASQVTVSIDETSQCLAIRVWNDGSSVATAEQMRIFERFYRGAEARRVTPGSGLGLYVSRKIAVAHGGRLELEHLDGAEGIAFRFQIPHSESGFEHDTEM